MSGYDFSDDELSHSMQEVREAEHKTILEKLIDTLAFTGKTRYSRRV